MNRRLLAAGLVAVITGAVVARPAAAAQAVDEIDGMLRRGIEAYAQAGSARARLSAVTAFLEQDADMARVARFVLGLAVRTATPGEIAAFQSALTGQLARTLVAALARMDVRALRKLTAIERSPIDVIVGYALPAGDGGGLRQIAIRAVQRDGRFRIVDVEAEGIWLAILQQRQTADLLNRPGASLADLIVQMQSQDG